MKDDLTEYKCLFCDKNYQQKFDEKLKERFCNTSKSSNPDNNKFLLLLQEGFYPYEYMDDWKKFIHMQDIEDADYAHAKRVCKDFGIKKIRKIS